MINRLFLSTLFIVGFTLIIIPTFGQGWTKKPYTEWSMGDVERILNNSPWAQTQIESRSINYDLPGNSYLAIIRLRSALPIRQALLRQKQFQLNYGKFNAVDKARFDKETEQFVQCPDCVDYYIVTVRSPMFADMAAGQKPGFAGFDVLAPLRHLSLAEIKSSVYLENDKGERRNIVRFIPPKGEHEEAMFVFPRKDSQGRTLITGDNKAFYFKIDERLFKGTPMPLKPFKFGVQELTQNGEIVF
jgi:hypothetical protein